MKKYEINPTDENLINALEKDIVKRNSNIKDFIQLLEHLDDNTSISINGEWGSGKTFFVKQIYLILNYLNPYINNTLEQDLIQKIDNVMNSDNFKDFNVDTNFLPIYYNAWDNDSHTDPILSIIYNIIKEKGSRGEETISKSNLMKLARIIDLINPWSSGALGDLIESVTEETIISPILSIENMKITLKELLENTLAEKGDKIIVFIDELDRCNPKYAINLLERIKHFFNDDRIIFVFSTNVLQLTNIIKSYYGGDFDSYKYLNKFFDLTFELNDVNINEYIFSLENYSNSYYFDNVVIELCKYYRLSMRDCNRVIQMAEITREYVNKDRQGFNDTTGYQMTLMFILPVLLVLKVIDIKKYIDIESGRGFEEFKKIVLEVEILNKGIDNFTTTNGEISSKRGSFESDLEKIYKIIFLNNGKETYISDKIELDRHSKRYLMEIVSLINKNLKYN